MDGSLGRREDESVWEDPGRRNRSLIKQLAEESPLANPMPVGIPFTVNQGSSMSDESQEPEEENSAVQVYEGAGRDSMGIDAKTARRLKKLEDTVAEMRKESQERCMKVSEAEPAVNHKKFPALRTLGELLTTSHSFLMVLIVDVVLITVAVAAWRMGAPWSDTRLLISLPCTLFAMALLWRDNRR
jgi:hypothetical protein